MQADVEVTSDRVRVRAHNRLPEAYNFQKVSGVLADFSFATIRLTDDWQGADFIAQHIDGQQFPKLKGQWR